MKAYKTKELISLKIYLKNKIRPLCFELETKEQKEDLLHQFLSSDIITIGPLVFPRENLSYMFFE